MEELQDPEYGQVWDRFRQQFGFRPGMSSGSWPAIREPEQSISWSLRALDDDPGYGKLDAMVDGINAAFRACTPQGGSLLVLDWQHTCYRTWPNAIGTERVPPWVASVMPDGDYNIHLAEDFSYGTFGHPWENTICVMGEALVDRVSESLDAILVDRVREGGRPTRAH